MKYFTNQGYDVLITPRSPLPVSETDPYYVRGRERNLLVGLSRLDTTQNPPVWVPYTHADYQPGESLRIDARLKHHEAFVPIVTVGSYEELVRYVRVRGVLRFSLLSDTDWGDTAGDPISTRVTRLNATSLLVELFLHGSSGGSSLYVPLGTIYTNGAPVTNVGGRVGQIVQERIDAPIYPFPTRAQTPAYETPYGIYARVALISLGSTAHVTVRDAYSYVELYV